MMTIKPARNENNLTNQNDDLLNVAMICPATAALGPGLRSVVWVQGCERGCAGCLAPEFQVMQPVRRMTPGELVEELLVNPLVSGMTISGGEPLLQALTLAKMVRLARNQRDLDVICYTGYSLEEIFQEPPSEGVWELLAEVDVLIDGPYVQALNQNCGLRGSSNQRIHHLSHRLRGYDFENGVRRIELQIHPGEVFLIGIPTKEMSHLDQVLFSPFNQGITFNNKISSPNITLPTM